MHLRTVRSDEGMLLKQVRLRALADAPYAFGGVETLPEEQALPDEHWHQLAREVEAWRDRCISYFILDGDEVCATGSCYMCSRVARRAYFSAAWVDPRYRRHGLGKQLVTESIDWARVLGADHLKLWVDHTNPGAAAFYRSLGFIATGENRPVSRTSQDRESSFELRMSES